jgi:hypothetical protein
VDAHLPMLVAMRENRLFGRHVKPFGGGAGLCETSPQEQSTHGQLRYHLPVRREFGVRRSGIFVPNPNRTIRNALIAVPKQSRVKHGVPLALLTRHHATPPVNPRPRLPADTVSLLLCAERSALLRPSPRSLAHKPARTRRTMVVVVRADAADEAEGCELPTIQTRSKNKPDSFIGLAVSHFSDEFGGIGQDLLTTFKDMTGQSKGLSRMPACLGLVLDDERVNTHLAVQCFSFHRAAFGWRAAERRHPTGRERVDSLTVRVA